MHHRPSNVGQASSSGTNVRAVRTGRVGVGIEQHTKALLVEGVGAVYCYDLLEVRYKLWQLLL